MRVLLIHHGDGGYGGAQVQMNRLHAGLRQRGVDARIMCHDRTRADSIAMPRHVVGEKLLGKVSRRIGLNDVHNLSAFKILRHPAFIEADVVDFHGIYGGFFSFLAMPRLTAEKPAVFTFHDMWPLTGHCHASLDCTRWQTGCGGCPHLDTSPAVRRDATALEWRLKKWVYDRSKFTVVAPSRWLCDLTSQSMLHAFPVRHIPHGIDTTVFRPLDQTMCRSLLGIPAGKQVLLFAVEHLARPLKGGDLLQNALQSLPACVKRQTVLLFMGGGGPLLSSAVGMPIVDLGFVRNDRLKAIAYSAADLFLHPTRAENFPLVLLESFACGTPAVSFRVGGVPELVRPGQTGFLAEPENADDLSAGIVRLLEDPRGRRLMKERCREVAVAEYSLDTQIDRYLDLYRKVAGCLDATQTVHEGERQASAALPLVNTAVSA